MKAAVIWEANQPITIENVQIGKPGPREVLIRTAFAGVCHSDLHFEDGTYPYPKPYVPGHESAGIVEAVGDDVTYVQKGDHVVTCLSVFCGCCSQCVTGHPNLCESTDVKLPPGKAERLWLNGKIVHQFSNLSSFAEQMLVHENAIVKIRRDLPLDRAALVGCGVLTGVGAVVHAAKVKPGSTVVVIGCGGVGLSVVNGAAIAGAARVIAVDMLQSKLDLAKKIGATDVIDASRRQRIARGSGVDPAEVTGLVKQFIEMRRMMKQMGGFGTKKLKNKRKDKGGKSKQQPRGSGSGRVTPKGPPKLPKMPLTLPGLDDAPAGGGLPGLPGLPGFPK